MIQWVRHYWNLMLRAIKCVYLISISTKMPTIEGLLSSECNSTGLVQPLDVVFLNVPLMIWQLITYKKISIIIFKKIFLLSKQHRILLTTWIGETWEKTCTIRDMVVRWFRK